MNIVAIAGSNHKNSRTRRLLNLWLQRMAELDRTIHYEVLLLRDFNIMMCEGCEACIRHGECVLDQKDDMPLLRKKLQETDGIIFSSPVCNYNMSGIMKNFMDRMAFAFHQPVLAGKYGFTLTTTKELGEEIVSNMLWRMQSGLGIKNLDNFTFRVLEDELASSREWAKTAVEALGYQKGFRARREDRFKSGTIVWR